jgi:hypothetical protein
MANVGLLCNFPDIINFELEETRCLQVPWFNYPVRDTLGSLYMRARSFPSVSIPVELPALEGFQGWNLKSRQS